MKTQKLGRGLDALLGEMDEAYENEGSSKDTIVEISLKEIRPNPYQPRKSFEDSALYELSESIKNDGLLQPVVVTEDIDGYVLIAGERRLRASKLAKLKTIRAIILNSDEQKMRQFALIENIQREELNAVELANSYAELIDVHEITHDELSSVVHKSRSQITNTMRLLTLSPYIQEQLILGKISQGHAKVLVGLDDKKQKVIIDSVIGQKLSVRETENMVKNHKENPSKNTAAKVIKFFTKEYAEEIKFFLPFTHKIKAKSIEINFTDEKDIENFLTFLKKL